MKKGLLAIGLFATLSSLVSANGFDTKVSVGASSAKINGDSYTQYGAGYTANTTLGNGLILGFGNSLSYGNLRSGVEVMTVDLDLRAGYEIIRDLTAFALGTGIYQYLDDESATGLGYGASLEYKVTSNVYLEGTYKTTKMRYSATDYDYDLANVSVKFNY